MPAAVKAVALTEKPALLSPLVSGPDRAAL